MEVDCVYLLEEKKKFGAYGWRFLVSLCFSLDDAVDAPDEYLQSHPLQKFAASQGEEVVWSSAYGTDSNATLYSLCIYVEYMFL